VILRQVGQVATSLIGRDEELAAVEALLDRSASGALLLEGEPGIGKTTLWPRGRATRREHVTVRLAGLPRGVDAAALAAPPWVTPPKSAEEAQALAAEARRRHEAALGEAGRILESWRQAAKPLRAQVASYGFGPEESELTFWFDADDEPTARRLLVELAEALGVGIADVHNRVDQGANARRRRATTIPARHPGARPPGGGWIDPTSSPLRARSQEVIEFEFHISPAASSSRPHTGVGA